MQPSEALGISAQIAVTLAGFTGIVVVFAARSVHEWSPADQFRLRLLLLTSAVPLALSLTGLMLLAIDMRKELVWGMASAAAIFVLIGSLATLVRAFHTLPKGAFERAGGNRTIFYAASTTTVAVALLQFVNIFVWGVFWPFFLCVVFALLISILQFTRLVLYRPGSGSE